MRGEKKKQHDKKNETILSYISAAQLISAGVAWL